MVSVIIPAEVEEPALIDTLAALVEGVAQGVVRDCVVVSTVESAIFRQCADAAGCLLTVLPGSRTALIQHGANLVRSTFALVIAPGLVPTGDWLADLSDFLDEGPKSSEAAIFPYHARRGWRSGVKSLSINLSARLTRRPHALQGMIMATSLLRQAPLPRLSLRMLDARMVDRRLAAEA